MPSFVSVSLIRGIPYRTNIFVAVTNFVTEDASFLGQNFRRTFRHFCPTFKA